MKNFWSRNAVIYDRFMRKNKYAYKRMYKLIKPIVKGKDVLEVAAGTGLVARNIVCTAKSVEITDISPEMIKTAKNNSHSHKLHFSVQDMFCLPYGDKSFPIIIVSNALHVVDDPSKALAELMRVLTDDGILIAADFLCADRGFFKIIRLIIMEMAGLLFRSKWDLQGYRKFLELNDLTIRRLEVFSAASPLAYAECEKNKPDMR